MNWAVEDYRKLRESLEMDYSVSVHKEPDPTPVVEELSDEPVDLAELRKVAARLSYRPGHRIDIVTTSWNNYVCAPRLEVIGENVPDASGAGVTHTNWCVSLGVGPSGLMSPRDLIRLVQYITAEGELHERDEWLKLDGRQIRPPHSPTAYSDAGVLQYLPREDGSWRISSYSRKADLLPENWPF